MLTKTVKTTNGDLKLTIPTKRDEISIDLLQRLTPPVGHSYSFLEQISIMTGVPTGDKEFDKREIDVDTVTLNDIETLYELSPFEDALQGLAYQLAAFQEVQEIPDKITLPIARPLTGWFRSPGKRFVEVEVIKNLGIEPAGAYMEAKEVIKSEWERWEKVKKEYGDHIEFNPSIESQIKLLAIYFYCRATGEKFKTHKIAEFSEVIKKLSITHALPIARYFFLRYPNLSKPKVTPSVQTLKLFIKKQGYTS